MCQFVTGVVLYLFLDVGLLDKDAFPDARIGEPQETWWLDADGASFTKLLVPSTGQRPQFARTQVPQGQGNAHQNSPRPGRGMENKTQPRGHDIDAAVSGRSESPARANDFDASFASSADDLCGIFFVRVKEQGQPGDRFCLHNPCPLQSASSNARLRIPGRLIGLVLVWGCFVFALACVEAVRETDHIINACSGS